MNVQNFCNACKQPYSVIFSPDLILPVPIPDEYKIFSSIFILTLLCGASKGFMMALKAFIKPFEVRQRSAEIKSLYNFLKYTRWAMLKMLITLQALKHNCLPPTYLYPVTPLLKCI